ncbi:hypothetical protein C1H21_07705 [Xanthomonas arboricola pv. juglandis]|nr:hypothetical protein C1H21_07705 [Xanthomonas arboricola pv. juglandis]
MRAHPKSRPGPRLRRWRSRARVPVARKPCLLAPARARRDFSSRDVFDCVAWRFCRRLQACAVSRRRGSWPAGGRPGRAAPGGRVRIRR